MFYEADTRKINYVLDNLPSGGSKGILSLLNINDGEITEDDAKRGEKKIQELTDSHCKETDEIFSSKEKEIMTI